MKLDFLPRHVGSYYGDPRVGPARERLTSIEALGQRAGAMWPLSSPHNAVDVRTALREGGLDFEVMPQRVVAVLPGPQVDLFGSQDPEPILLEAPKHRALVRDAASGSYAVLGVVTASYAIAQNAAVLEAAMGLATRFGEGARPMAAAAIGTPVGSTVHMAVTLVRLGDEVASILLVSNSHHGGESVRFKIVPVHLPTATLLCPSAELQEWTERHQGDLEDRLEQLASTSERVPDWMARYLQDFTDGCSRLQAAGCDDIQFTELVAGLWPSNEKPVWAPGNVRLEHPSTYLRGHNSKRSAWDAYINVCEFIDHYSEARDKNDSTKERDERLVRGAGDKLKRKCWSDLLKQPG